MPEAFVLIDTCSPSPCPRSAVHLLSGGKQERWRKRRRRRRRLENEKARASEKHRARVGGGFWQTDNRAFSSAKGANRGWRQMICGR